MKLTGTWLGEYTYGPGYGPIAGTSVPFRLSLTESLLRSFAGYVRDDATKGGMPERGRIAGRRAGDAITFVKTMPVGYVTDDDGKPVEKRTWLKTMFGIDRSEVSPHRIHYSGTLAADGQQMRGAWVIHSEVIAEQDDVVHCTGGEGTWTARRISDLPSEV